MARAVRAAIVDRAAKAAATAARAASVKAAKAATRRPRARIRARVPDRRQGGLIHFVIPDLIRDPSVSNQQRRPGSDAGPFLNAPFCA